ncbi:MAG TPA: hypothetical protein GX505_12945 [Clostridiales bacterium]|nr:hypothetical protein [Clostridiales bacterium]
MDHLFEFLLQGNKNDDSCDKLSVEGTGISKKSKAAREKLYVSEKLFVKISKYLERKPQMLRCNEVCEDGWFNKKESYVQKRLKHKRKEGKYCLGISDIYRSYNGHRITRYQLYWLYERDVFYINKGIPLEPSSEVVAADTLPYQYDIVNMDKLD